MVKKREARSNGQAILPGMRTPKEIFRDIRNHLAGQYIGATRDDALLDELLKCLFCKLYLETSKTKDTSIEGDSFEAAQFYRGIFAKVREEFPEIYSGSDEILLDPPNLLRTMRSLEFSLLDANRDPIGDAYEVFAGSESRGRTGQFFTPLNAVDLLVRAVDPQPGDKIIDPACGAGGFLAAVSRHLRKNGASDSELAKSAKNFFGVEKDSYLARLARLHVSLLTRGHVGIRCGDSLALVGENGAPLKDSMPTEGYDVLLTNPPFGANIVSANPDVLRTFDLAKRWHEGENGWEQGSEMRSQVPPQVLFVERCLKLVKQNGKIGMVLPESVLSNKSYRYVVEYLRRHATPEAIIGMPEDLFKTSGKGGTHTKTCLLVLRKNVGTTKKLFMAEAQWCGHDSRAREIPFDDLPKIGDALTAYRSGKKLKPSHNGFTMDLKSITDNVLCPRYYNPELDEEIEKLRATHDLVTFGSLLEDGTLDIATGHEVGKLAYGSGEVPFVRTSDISNWEIKADPKHLVDREIFKSLEKKQDVRENDILMVKDGTYLVGTCAIVTEYDREIIYQSHIYKIRVLKTDRLSAYLLLAVLSSSIVQRQVKAKRFTQDIIDSLGDRIKELILPIPKDAAKRKKIDDMVRQVVIERVKARELARLARVEVLT